MKTRVITAIVGIIVLIGVMFTFNTLIFNLVIAAITLIAVHEIYSALGFEKKDWLMYAVLVPYTLLVMTSNYQVMRRLVMPMSFLLVTFYAIYLVVRNGTISYQKASGHAGAGEPPPLPCAQPARYRCAAPRRGRGRADEPAVKRFLLRNGSASLCHSF